MSVRQRLRHVLVAANQLILSLLTLGSAYPDETISSALWRMELSGRWQGRLFRPVVDFLWSHILRIESEHCYKSFVAAVRRRQIPPELRDLTHCCNKGL